MTFLQAPQQKLDELLQHAKRDVEHGSPDSIRNWLLLARDYAKRENLAMPEETVFTLLKDAYLKGIINALQQAETYFIEGKRCPARTYAVMAGIYAERLGRLTEEWDTKKPLP